MWKRGRAGSVGSWVLGGGRWAFKWARTACAFAFAMGFALAWADAGDANMEPLIWRLERALAGSVQR